MGVTCACHHIMLFVRALNGCEVNLSVGRPVGFLWRAEENHWRAIENVTRRRANGHDMPGARTRIASALIICDVSGICDILWSPLKRVAQ